MKRFLQFFIILITLSTLVKAGTTGKLTGQVTDERTGEPLPFVNITLEGTTIGAATDLEGKYVILNIQPGKYNVKFQYLGYQTKIMSEVNISIDLTTRIDITLAEATVEIGEVIVQAESGGIKKDVTSSQSLVSSEEIENLPVAELNDLLELQSGVTTDKDGGFHIRGSRSEEIAYKVNGISVTDSYDKSRGIEIDNSSIQELQVISGTFNAEHGEAMSGIINTVTKEGQSDFHGDVKLYSSDYYSSNKDIFYNIDNVNPVQNYNVQASLSGPIPLTNDKIRFFVNGRYNYDDGWLYGERQYNVDGSPGDGESVAMNYSKRLIGVANLSWFASSAFKFNLEGLFSDEEFKDYNHDYKLNPDGDVTKFSKSLSTTFTMTHTFSSSSFYTVKASYFNREFNEYTFENPYDSRYLHPDSLNKVNYAFHDKGTNLHRFYRTTGSFIGKFDFTSQVSEHHLVKFGFEGKTDKLEYDDYNLEPKTVNNVQVTPFVPQIPSVTATAREIYDADPIAAAAYIQDKIEFDDVIINIGLRLDYFDSQGKVLVDPEDPNINVPLRDELKDLTLAEREPYFYKDATAKWQLAPRFGIAYPISESGVVHFSYGQFLQIPQYQRLFDRASYKVPTTGSTGSVYGNPDLEPEKTTQYEIGFRQEFFEDYLVDMTMYYKDIRDYITAGAFIETRNGVPYSIFTNRDYSNVKGVTVNLSKRYSNNFSLNLNYTYQFAEGSNSTPEDDFNAQRGNDEPTLYLIPLDWDQRHMINGSFYYGMDSWGASLIARYGTGLPYTPAITQATADRGLTSGYSRNIRRKPDQFYLDFKVHNVFNIGGYEITLYAKVFNLLDSEIITDVFTDTGLADFTTEAQSLRNVIDENRPNTVGDYLTRPYYYEAPRKIQIGLDFSF
ncbi:MAG: TonB-dependent receptor [Ignavibacteriae bacterium]|nr:TonB-dependent receptor [Ignavibacteriota bacterium]MCB9257900.1 TonB-dependent receptor [Ignavibacteriales bacterium]